MKSNECKENNNQYQQACWYCYSQRIINTRNKYIFSIDEIQTIQKLSQLKMKVNIPKHNFFVFFMFFLISFLALEALIFQFRKELLPLIS